ncbi:arginine metabolism regulation protein II [Fusarium torreyae]|uniref:Arginine metabolism regulation protein II n=1 Tax=Fusarium torreyae TaxID=1237075 RepID=A0A9W8RTG3_9HYPO|nr:arginine metabolism regulation protein II [Fusarium torreyae]
MSPPDLAPARPANQPRKRTKTFTGCWTCRARKIKCDEGKPTCRQCRDKQVVCNGYGSRLQWLTPEVVDLTGRMLSACSDVPAPQTHRRVIPPAQPKRILSWSRIEEILRYIDTVEIDPQPNSHNAGAAVIHNFGVFSVKFNSHSEPVCALTGSSDHDGPRPSSQVQSGGDELGYIPISGPFFDSFPSPTSLEEAAVAWDLCNLYYRQPPLELEEPGASTSPDADKDLSPLAFTHQPYDLPDTSLDLGFDTQASATNDTVEENIPGPSWLSNRHDSPRSLEPFVVPVQERFLMDHYKNRVVNLFCVVDNRKSPWKTIHLPLVLQSVGELSFGGDTTRIRNALRYALYSVSAFYLSNEHKSALSEGEANKWFDAASQYRCDAIGLLTSAVESDLYGSHRPRYKEFLATMLSMITINVMSGDTSTCAMHLNGAEQLIRHMSLHKSKFSRKAHALHRIYLYLRVIYESTAPKSKNRPSPRLSPLLGSFGTAGSHPALVSSGGLDLSDTHADGEGPPDETATYECIYGIPRALLLMLKEAIEVIDMVDDEREKGSIDVSESLTDTCEKLESKILDWHLVDRGQDSNGSTNARIIYYQTKAFHNALIVYFSQHVRLLGYRYQRQYVTEILESIEAIEKIKAETNILAAPLFWPAFIGATEAFEPVMQDRFRKWYDAASLYGLAAVRTGIEVIHKVWEYGPSNGRRMKSAWRMVVDEGQHILMLT